MSGTYIQRLLESACAPSTRCPYATSGADLAYGATSSPSTDDFTLTLPESGTGIAYDGTGIAHVGTGIAH
eukprot:2533551-Rhodomonas_salina.1